MLTDIRTLTAIRTPAIPITTRIAGIHTPMHTHTPTLIPISDIGAAITGGSAATIRATGVATMVALTPIEADMDIAAIEDMHIAADTEIEADIVHAAAMLRVLLSEAEADTTGRRARGRPRRRRPKIDLAAHLRKRPADT